jgi:hypothetical protein
VGEVHWRFAASVFHADLTAHNCRSAAARDFLLDFDRGDHAGRRRLATTEPEARTVLTKISRTGGIRFGDTEWRAMLTLPWGASA